MGDLSSSDSLLGWANDELDLFASYGASLFPKSMILNTSVAENSSNVIDGLDTDEPIEMPLSLSRTRACACSTAPGSCSFVLNISLSSRFLLVAESPMLLLSMYDKTRSVYEARRREGGAPVCRCWRTSPAASSWRRGRQPRRRPRRSAKPCGSRSASAGGSGSGSGSERRAARARRAVKSSEALVMAGGGGYGTRGAVAMVRDCELLSPTGCSDGEGTATEALARRWRRRWGYGAEMASLPLPLLLVLGLFVSFVESGRRWRRGLGLKGDDGRSRRTTITTVAC